ncbi:MAG: hypothetical protein ABIG61_01910 [Planctomycetota bacterium]
MPAIEKLKHIAVELKGHAPFTACGALAGIVFMLVFHRMAADHAEKLFVVFHPAHVLLSAMVTASLFSLHRKAKNLLLILIIGYVGSVGIATLSDSVVPYIGETLLGLHVPTHAHTHTDHGQADKDEEFIHKVHLGFIEEWYIVNPAAILGVLIACLLPRTKLPHAAHVLISTWASLSHIMMNTTVAITPSRIIGIFITLFIAVWVPCCISDIVFPLLFVKSDIELKGICPQHVLHSHPHAKDSAESQK